jgi:hypothetical protein
MVATAISAPRGPELARLASRMPVHAYSVPTGCAHLAARARGVSSQTLLRVGWLAAALVCLALLPSVEAASSCFLGGDTSEMICCAGSAVEIDTDAGTITSPPTGTDQITFTSTQGTAATTSHKGIRSFSFGNIVMSGATVTLKGTRALQLVSQGGIGLDQVTFDASPSAVSYSLSPACSGFSSIRSWQTARIGGFNGASAQGFNLRRVSTSSGPSLWWICSKEWTA